MGIREGRVEEGNDVGLKSNFEDDNLLAYIVVPDVRLGLRM